MISVNGIIIVPCSRVEVGIVVDTEVDVVTLVVLSKSAADQKIVYG